MNGERATRPCRARGICFLSLLATRQCKQPAGRAFPNSEIFRLTRHSFFAIAGLLYKPAPTVPPSPFSLLTHASYVCCTGTAAINEAPLETTQQTAGLKRYPLLGLHNETGNRDRALLPTLNRRQQTHFPQLRLASHRSLLGRANNDRPPMRLSMALASYLSQP